MEKGKLKITSHMAQFVRLFVWSLSDKRINLGNHRGLPLLSFSFLEGVTYKGVG